MMRTLLDRVLYLSNERKIVNKSVQNHEYLFLVVRNIDRRENEALWKTREFFFSNVRVPAALDGGNSSQ